MENFKKFFIPPKISLILYKYSKKLKIPPKSLKYVNIVPYPVPLYKLIFEQKNHIFKSHCFAGKIKNPPQALGPQRASEAYQPVGLAEDKLHNEVQGGLSLAEILYI